MSKLGPQFGLVFAFALSSTALAQTTATPAASASAKPTITIEELDRLSGRAKSNISPKQQSVPVAMLLDQADLIRAQTEAIKQLIRKVDTLDERVSKLEKVTAAKSK